MPAFNYKFASPSDKIETEPNVFESTSEKVEMKDVELKRIIEELRKFERNSEYDEVTVSVSAKYPKE